MPPFSRNLYMVIVLACACVLTINVAKAAVSNGRFYRSGTVIMAKGCHNKFSVITDNGYTIIDWIGGTPVIEEDYLTGNMQNHGKSELLNVTQSTTVIGLIEYSLLNEDDYRAKLAAICN